MNLPAINIAFTKLANSFEDRSRRGTIAMILKDGTGTDPIQYVFYSKEDIVAADWTESNYLALSLAFLGKPLKIIAIKIPTTASDYTIALSVLENLRWNYLTIPDIAVNSTAAVVAWIKEQRESYKRLFKAVLPKTAADHEGIINFSTDTIKTTITDADISCQTYCARIAGLLAGLSVEKSATFYKLNEVLSCFKLLIRTARLMQESLLLFLMAKIIN